VKRRVEDLTGQELDTAVALAEGWQLMFDGRGWVEPKFIPGVGAEQVDCSVFHAAPLPWSTDWALGGPLLDRERIATWPTVLCADLYDLREDAADQLCWAALHPDSRHLGGWRDNMGGLDVTARDGMPGATPLAAGMRAWVQAKFGDEIDLP
jgi:hypothetical protein